jgi:hypothetical protein
MHQKALLNCTDHSSPVTPQKEFIEQDFNKRINTLADKYKNKKIVFYGAGYHFLTMHSCFDLSKLNIIGIADIKFGGQGEYLGYKSYSPFEISELNPDIVLITIPNHSIAADFFENEIFPNYGKFQYEHIFEQTKQENNLNMYDESTQAYIENNMSGVPYIPNKYTLMSKALNEAQVDGLYLEFGVCQGTTVNYIANVKKDKTVYGFDSFEGLPEKWRTAEKGTFKVDKLPSVRQNVSLIKGWYDESLPLFVKEHNEPVAFIHVDCDLYSSTKTLFRELASNIQCGTVIFFDEYFNYSGWEEHEYKAFQEFCKQNNVEYKYLWIHYSQVVVKIVAKSR